MKKVRLNILFTLISFILLLQCGDRQQRVVARVGDQEITVNEFKQFILTNAGDEKFYSTPEQLKIQLNKLIDRKLKLIDAYRNALDRDEQLLSRLKFFEREAVYYFTIDKEVYEKIVPDSMVKSLYQNLKNEIKLQHIFLPINRKENKLDSLRNLLKNIAAQISTADDFFKIAAELSKDTSTALDGSDLGYLKWGEKKLGEQFYRIAFGMKKGEIIGPVESVRGLHLILLEDRRDTHIPAYKELEYQLRQNLIRFKGGEVSKWMDVLEHKARNKFKIRLDEANIRFLLTRIQEVRKSSGDQNHQFIGSQLTQYLRKDDLNRELFAFGKTFYYIKEFISEEGMLYPASSPEFDTLDNFKELMKKRVQAQHYIIEWGYHQGYHRSPGVKKTMQENKETELIKEIERRRIHNRIKNPSREILQDYFERHREKYHTEKKMKVHAITVHKKAFAQQIARRAKISENFDKLSRWYSENTLHQAIVEKLGFISEAQYGAVGKIAAQMQVGEVSEPIQTEAGFSVIKVLEIKPEKQLEFKKVQSKVQLDLRLSRIDSLRRQWLNGLKQEINIVIDDDVLDKTDLDY